MTSVREAILPTLGGLAPGSASTSATCVLNPPSVSLHPASMSATAASPTQPQSPLEADRPIIARQSPGRIAARNMRLDRQYAPPKPNPAAERQVAAVLRGNRRRGTSSRRRSAGRSRRPGDRLRLHRKQTLSLQFLASELARPPNRLGFLARPLLRGLLVMSAKFHFAEYPLALHLLLQRLEGLIDVVVANEYLHGPSCVLRPSLERSED